MKKVIKALDHPNMWTLYLILFFYLMYASVSILVGLRKYNLVLNQVETNKSISSSEINSQLSKCGFNITWGQTPKLTDYLYAGM